MNLIKIFINKQLLKTIICYNIDIIFALQGRFGLIWSFGRKYLPIKDTVLENVKQLHSKPYFT